MWEKDLKIGQIEPSYIIFFYIEINFSKANLKSFLVI